MMQRPNNCKFLVNPMHQVTGIPRCTSLLCVFLRCVQHHFHFVHSAPRCATWTSQLGCSDFIQLFMMPIVHVWACSVSFVCMDNSIGCTNFVCERKLKKQLQKKLICGRPFKFLCAKAKGNRKKTLITWLGPFAKMSDAQILKVCSVWKHGGSFPSHHKDGRSLKIPRPRWKTLDGS